MHATSEPDTPPSGGRSGSRALQGSRRHVPAAPPSKLPDFLTFEPLGNSASRAQLGAAAEREPETEASAQAIQVWPPQNVSRVYNYILGFVLEFGLTASSQLACAVWVFGNVFGSNSWNPGNI